MKINEIVSENNDLNEGVGTAIKAGYQFFKSTAPKVLGIIKTIGLIGPFISFARNMYNAKSNYEAGSLSEEEYNKTYNIQLGMLVSNLAAALIGNAVLSIPSKFLGVFSFMIPRPIQSLIMGLTQTGQAAFLTWINTEEGRTAIATILSSQVIEFSGAVVAKAIDTVKAAIDHITSQDGQGAHSAEQPTTAADQTPAAPTPKPEEGGSWVDLTPRIQQNTVTGKTRIKPY